MSSGDVEARAKLFSQWASVCKLVIDGKRRPERVSVALQSVIDSPDDQLPNIDWLRVYAYLGLFDAYWDFTKKHDHEIARAAKEHPDLWVTPVIKGVTCNKVVDVMKELGVDFWLYSEDLDNYVAINDRNPRKGSYSVGFFRTVGGAEGSKYLSADQLREGGHKGITLLERLLLGLGYFLTTRQHLDVENITLCSGSRYIDGCVPSVYYDDITCVVQVNWFCPDDAVSQICVRPVVSLP